MMKFGYLRSDLCFLHGILPSGHSWHVSKWMFRNDVSDHTLANFRDDLITACTHNFQTFELPTALKNNNHEKNFQHYWKQYS